MEQIIDNALTFFHSGLNCAQSVLLAYSERFNIDKELALSLSCGFGAGIGRLQETCGAVLGSVMVMSFYNCNKYQDNSDRKEYTYEMILNFYEKFISIHGTANCMSLINCDLKTVEGRKFAKEKGLFNTICAKCITDSITLLENMISFNQ